jgi:hypothetical protein
MLPTEGVGWKEAIAVVSGLPAEAAVAFSPVEQALLRLLLASVLQPLTPLFCAALFWRHHPARRGRQAPNYSKRYRTNAVQVRDGPEFGAGVAWVVGAKCSGS